jgi:para-nitrobenzyl esterase
MIVTIPAGKVRGLERRGSTAFLGIPFAAPPTGANRFRAPAPVSAWDGVRDATACAATPQRRPFGDEPTIPEPSVPGDATLNVNVFTPAPGDSRAALPVLVWIHGGAYFAGSPASPWYDGRSFNRDGVVTVTVSYRLGFDGFGWIGGAPANRGLLDQIAALRWVQDTIAEFGGDPSRVTVAGQSAGGGSVLSLMSSPLAAGLFRAAISESGALSRIRPDAARATAARMARAAGVDGGIDGWLAVDETTVLDHQWPLRFAGVAGADTTIAEAVRAMQDGRGDLLGFGFAPVVDGEILLEYEEAVRSGPHRDTPLLLGTNADEFPVPSEPVDAREVEAALREAGASAVAVRRFLADAAPLGPALLRSRLLAGSMFRSPAVHQAAERARAGAGARTWLYDFRHPAGPRRLAAHCLELPFVWDLLDAPGAGAVLGAAASPQLADVMHADWVRFVRDAVCDWPSVDDQPAGARLYRGEPGHDPGAYRLERELLS